MRKQGELYLSAPEVSDLLGVSIGHAYKMIREMNNELKKSGYITIAGKVPKRYFSKCCYGYID